MVPVAPVVDPASAGPEPWAALVADLRGAPPVPALARSATTTLAAVAQATAGFRDQYYGVAPFVGEAPATRLPRAPGLVHGAGDDTRPAGSATGARWAALVTAGLVDPLRCRWGLGATRFDHRRWAAPEVDLTALGAADPHLASWAEARLVPKLVVATQTRVLEAAVDEHGWFWPSVPTLALVPRADLAERDRVDLWELAAVLHAPATSAWALSRFGGAALSSDAIKLSASQLLEVPLPPDRAAWARGAAAAERAHRAALRGEPARWAEALDQLGAAMDAAYGVDELTSWWSARRPAWR